MKKRHFLLSLCIMVASMSLAQNKPYHGDGPDDLLQYVPYASVFALKACGVESSSSWTRLVVNAGASYVVNAGVVWSLKHVVKSTRPDGTDRRSFPSGHSAIAFAGATVLAKEYGHTSPWIALAGYGVATATAIDRVSRNRHHWGDVATGAAIGVLSTEAAYWLCDKVTGMSSQYAVGISPQGVSFVANF